jgi:hypothetical protein
MLSKKKFVQIMENLKRKYDDNNKFYDDWYNLFGSTPDWTFNNDYYSEAIEFLGMLMEDKDHVIDYFVCDCDWKFNSFQIYIEDKNTGEEKIFEIS